MSKRGDSESWVWDYAYQDIVTKDTGEWSGNGGTCKLQLPEVANKSHRHHRDGILQHVHAHHGPCQHALPPHFLLQAPFLALAVPRPGRHGGVLELGGLQVHIFLGRSQERLTHRLRSSVSGILRSETPWSSQRVRLLILRYAVVSAVVASPRGKRRRRWHTHLPRARHRCQRRDPNGWRHNSFFHQKHRCQPQKYCLNPKLNHNDGFLEYKFISFSKHLLASTESVNQQSPLFLATTFYRTSMSSLQVLLHT